MYPNDPPQITPTSGIGDSKGPDRRNAISIPISPRASFANHTHTIIYHRNHSQATDVVAIYSSCPRPYYVVRLSGPTLVGMQSMAHYHLNRSRIERMYYNHTRQVIVDRTDEGGTLTEIRLEPVIIPGAYGVEILQLTCNTTRTQLEYYCLPNSLDRLTLNKLVKVVLQKSDIPSRHGFWQRNTTAQSHSTPIRTRMQIDRPCRNKRGNCDGSLLQDYSFVNQSLHWPQRMDTNQTFCLVGDSHMDRLSASIEIMLQTYDPEAQNNVRFVLQHFPHEWDEFNISTTLTEYNCSMTILSIGIWSMSHRTEHPLDRLEWFHQMEQIINSFPLVENNFLLVLLIHPVPLGVYTTPCPPKAWFVPYMIDEYNQYLQMLSEVHPFFQGPNRKAKLIDSYPVLQAVWDGGSDWMHLDEPAQTPETHFTLNILANVMADKTVLQENEIIKRHMVDGIASPVWVVQAWHLLLWIMAIFLLGVMRFGKQNRGPCVSR